LIDALIPKIGEVLQTLQQFLLALLLCVDDAGINASATDV